MNEELMRDVLDALFLIAVIPITAFLNRKLKFYRIAPEVGDSKKDALFALVIILISFTLLFLLLSFESQDGPPPLSERQYTIPDILRQILLLLILSVPAIIYLLIRKPKLATLGITRVNLKNSFLLGLTISFLWLIFNAISFHLVLTLNYIFALINYTVVGFWEEGYFRGFLQLCLCAWLGDVKGWIVASIVFGLIHIPQRLFTERLDMLTSLLSAIFAILPGLVLGYMMLKTRNIVAPAILHTFINWVSTIR